MISTGSVMRGNSSRSRSSARTSAATVIAGCTSLAISGSLLSASTAFGIAREILVLELEHRQARRDVAEPLDGGEREARRRHLEGEALADEAGELRPGAPARRSHETTPPALWPSRNTGKPGCRDFASSISAGDVADVLGDVLDVETLAVGLAAAAQVEREDREAGGGELLGRPTGTGRRGN